MFDSIGKLKSYLIAFCEEPYQDLIPPKYLAISHTFWRDYTCPSGCGGCCKPFSMDVDLQKYSIIKEKYPEAAKEFEEHKFDLFGRDYTYFSNRKNQIEYFNLQASDPNRKCQFLDRQNGRCGIYEGRPLPCRMELNKFIYKKKQDKVIISKKLFGRGWSYLQVSGNKGALCEMIPISKQTLEIVKSRDIPLFEQLIKILDEAKVKHKGHIFLEMLNYQYDLLLNGNPIKPVTLIEKRKVLF